jgi:predicted HicB family RNase H-like nuclease
VPAPAKPKKIGRPKMPKGEAKGKIVPIRFAPEDLKAITAAAKASDQTISQWIRATLTAAIQG